MTAAAAPERRRASPLLAALLAAAFVIFVLYKTSELVFIAFIAALVAVYLASVTDLLGRKLKLPRGVLLILALLLTLLILAGIGALLAPPVVEQTQELIAALPRYLTALDTTVRDLASRYPLLRRTGISNTEGGLVSTLLLETAGFLRHEVPAYATLSGRILIEGVAVLVMAIYLALRPRMYGDGVVALVPPRHRDTARVILVDVATSLRAWVQAQIMAMVVLAALTGIGLWILGVPYFLAFAIFTGVAAMIPFFGTIFSTVLPALLVLGDRGIVASLAVASVGVIVHIIEANVVAPIIMQHHVKLPPVLTIFIVMVMAKLGGLLGLLVAVPMLATVMVLVRHILLQRMYGDAPLAPEPPLTN